MIAPANDDRALCEVTAAALALGRALDVWSLALTMLALATLLWLPAALPALVSACLWLALAAGLAEKIFALRVAFDEPIFRRWATTSSEAPDVLPAFDRALAALGVRASAAGRERDFQCRAHGALRLLRQQALAAAVQTLACLMAVALRFVPVV